ncbi:hypothetical protein ACFZBU_39390 [Embleya sp. NPDC008237]|uniref:hypothetical protein n=1 Tax=Embleya sp. NPDC008237 TaxID=3363978 RepID=UPI0036EC1F7A
MSVSPVAGPVVTREQLAEATPLGALPVMPVVVDWYASGFVPSRTASTTILRSSRDLGPVTARPAPTVARALELARTAGPQGLAYLPAARSRQALGAALAVSRLLRTIPPRTLNRSAHATARAHAPLIAPAPVAITPATHAVWFPHLVTIDAREHVVWELMRPDQLRAWAGRPPREMPAADLAALLPAFLRLRAVSRAGRLGELGADGHRAASILAVHPFTVSLVWRHPDLFRRLAERITRVAAPTA